MLIYLIAVVAVISIRHDQELVRGGLLEFSPQLHDERNVNVLQKNEIVG